MLHQRRERALLGVVALGGGAGGEKSRQALPQTAEQIGLARGAKFRIERQMLRLNHRAQHGIGQDDLHLAIDQREALAEIVAETRGDDLGADRVLLARIDQDPRVGRYRSAW